MMPDTDGALLILTQTQALIGAATALSLAATGLVSAIGAVLAARRAAAGVRQGVSNAARIAAVHGCVEAQIGETHERLDAMTSTLRNHEAVATTTKGRDAGDVPTPVEHQTPGLPPNAQRPG